MDTHFSSSQDEDIQRRVQEFLKPNSGVSGRIQGWLHMLIEPIGMRIVKVMQKAELAQFEGARLLYEAYQSVRQTTGMSLRSFCFSLHVYDNNWSWNYYRNWYRVFKHFVVDSEMKPEELLGVSFRLLRSVAESDSKIFNPRETQKLIIDLKKLSLQPQAQWEHLKIRREQIKAANENPKPPKDQAENQRYREDLFKYW